MKHKKKVLLMCIIIAIIFTGCDEFMLPEELIEKPNINETYDKVNEIVSELGSKNQLFLPNNIEEAGAINFVDITADKKDEIIILYEVKDKINNVVIQAYAENADGEYIILDSIKSEGKELVDIKFSDLNKDGRSELILQWNQNQNENKNNKRLVEIYSFQNEEFKSIFSETFSSLNLYDLDGDMIDDLVLFNYDKGNKNLSIGLYGMEQNEIKLINELNIFSTDKSEKGYSNLSVGKLTEDKSGMLLDISGENLSGYTTVIIKQNGNLIDIFNNKYLYEEEKKSLLTSRDVDNDGLLEMGVLVEQNIDGYTHKGQRQLIQKWYNWDGYKDVIFNEDIFNDYSLNLEFRIPSEWNDKYVFEVIYDTDENYVFFYEKDGYPEKKKEILRLCIINNNVWSDFKRELEEGHREYITLGESIDYTYIAIKNTVEVGYDKSMIVDDSVIVHNFNKNN